MADTNATPKSPNAKATGSPRSSKPSKPAPTSQPPPNTPASTEAPPTKPAKPTKHLLSLGTRQSTGRSMTLSPR